MFATLRGLGMDEPYRGYAPAADLAATAQRAIDDFQSKARDGYPAAAAAWQASNPPTGLTGSVPWLPYLPALAFTGTAAELRALQAYVGTREFPWPSPGPGGFNFGGNAVFSSGGAGFAQSADWQALIADSGGDPNAEYMSAFVQSPMLGAGSQDYARVLYMRAGPYWRPMVAYAAHRTSAWIEFRDFALKPALAFALAAGLGPWIVSQIGPAIVGPTFAAANPGITAAIGNTVMQTALNGGDVGSALRSVAAGFAGSVAGGQLGALADSPLLGKVSGAALATAIKGGDVQAAVAQTLLSAGASAAADYAQTLAMPAQSQLQTGDTSMAYHDPVYSEDDTLTADEAVALQPAWMSQIGEGSWSATDWSNPVPNAGGTDWNFNPTGMDAVLSNGLPTPPVATSTPAPGGSWVADVTNLALAAIKLNAAYQATKQQPRTVTQAGSTTYTPNANGTVTVRDGTTGRTMLQRPQVGVPYVLGDGSIIINNGDGTYDYTNAAGQTVKRSYSSAVASTAPSLVSSLANVPPVVWGLGAGLLLFMLRGRRRA